jgi:multicomponent Na+:H+ antiporter subunit G
MIQIIGTGLLILGMCFLLVGAFGILFLPNLYSRLLACGLIDTMGMIIIIIGLLFLSPNASYSLKMIIILIFTLAINPISAYAIGRSAFLRGERTDKKEPLNE